MPAQRPLRLLSLGHSYAVALNRRLPDEIARVANNEWSVTVAAPSYVHAELRGIPLEPGVNEVCQLRPLNAYFTSHLHFMTYGRQLRNILSRGWDMVHVYQEPYIFAGWQAAYWTPRKTPFVFFTNQNLLKRYPPPFGWMEQYCFRRCAGWIGCGDTVIEAMRQKNFHVKPHRMIPFGVDVEAFKPDPGARQRLLARLQWNTEPIPVVGFLGRFVPEKGLAFLTSVLDCVRAPWRALFIGSGPMEPFLKRWRNRYGNRVEIVGAVHSEVPDWLNVVDILCAPSQSASNWCEQFGRMIIEAFAVGCAVVGSDSGEIPHVIGEAGLVLPERDQERWVRALTELLCTKSLRLSYGQRGRARAVQRFAWSVVAGQHLEFFSELLVSKQAFSRRRSANRESSAEIRT